MARISIGKASDFLSEQLDRPGAPINRIGVVLQASLGAAADVARRLDDLVQGAWDKLDTALATRLADFEQENERAALLFKYAGSLRVPEDAQLGLLERGCESRALTTAAAQQRVVPSQVQRFLVQHCFDHSQAMEALARNPNSDLAVLEPLAAHTSKEVRLAVAMNIGPRMRLDEPAVKAQKAAIYNTLLHNYESDMAPYLVPVCRDEKQLEQMYSRTANGPSTARLFVENPFTPERVLLDVSTSMGLRVFPGGAAVAKAAKQQLASRLAANSDAAPQPF